MLSKHRSAMFLEDIWPIDYNRFDFKSAHPKALKQLFKLFESFLKDAELIAVEIIATNGTKFTARNRKKWNFIQKKMDKHKDYIDAKSQDIAESNIL